MRGPPTEANGRFEALVLNELLLEHVENDAEGDFAEWNHLEGVASGDHAHRSDVMGECVIVVAINDNLISSSRLESGGKRAYISCQSIRVMKIKCCCYTCIPGEQSPHGLIAVRLAQRHENVVSLRFRRAARVGGRQQLGNGELADATGQIVAHVVLG